VTPSRIRIVSKPLSPPWNDSGKNVPRDLVLSLPERPFIVFAARGKPLAAPHLRCEEVYRTAGTYQPKMSEKIRVLRRLWRREGEVSILHFFFAPNPLTCFAARRAIGRRPGVRVVQTVLSRPKEGIAVPPLLFGDEVVVLSDATREKLEKESGRRVRRIYPGIVPPAVPAAERVKSLRSRLGADDATVVFLFPGDLEFSGANERLCEVDDMPALLSASDVVIFPATSVYGKTDLPIVLLEALALGKPIVVPAEPPLGEILLEDGVAAGGGMAVVGGSTEAWAHALRALADDPARRRALGAAGPALVRRRFTARRMALEYEEVYRGLEERAASLAGARHA
jgi:hypothetical protein